MYFTFIAIFATLGGDLDPSMCEGCLWPATAASYQVT
jgi:hypothetical protein